MADPSREPMDRAIEVDRLGKRYRIAGPRDGYRSLREDIAAVFRRPAVVLSRTENVDFWALRDVSFSVAPGEVVGVVGRNGAGKSTLLKLLSRVTRPTEGRAVLHGRIGSLLEVGTGFHPELTGRENIYLSGSMLGLTRDEIRRQFDAIVDFAGVADFLQTPVKRYSSGMTVRLGFAVAAHLEPEILIIDEVLAVGDADFRRRCLEKMGEVARTGRTVLLVSHSMSSVERLCTRGLYLDGGRLLVEGTAAEAVAAYRRGLGGERTADLSSRTDRGGNGRIRVVQVTVVGEGDAVCSGQPASIELTLAGALDEPIRIAVVLSDQGGVRRASFDSEFVGSVLRTGGRVVLSIESLDLAPHLYDVYVWVWSRGETCDAIEGAARVSIEPADLYGTGLLPKVAQHGAALLRYSFST